MASAMAEVRARKLSTSRAQSPRRTAEVLEVQHSAPTSKARKASRERLPSFSGLLSAKGRSSSRDKDSAGSSKGLAKPPAAAAEAPSRAEEKRGGDAPYPIEVAADGPKVTAAGPNSVRGRALEQHLDAWVKRGGRVPNGGYSPAQHALIKRFRSEAFTGLDPTAKAWWDNDQTACRFLEARNWEYDKGLLMFRNHLEWRHRWNLDEIVQTATGLAPKLLVDLRIPEIAALKAAVSFSHHGVSPAGHPLYFDRIGRMDLGKLKQASTLETLTRYWVWYQEATSVVRLPAASLQAGELITTSVYILDLSGFHIGMFNAELRHLLKELSSISADNYPESMECTFIVNAPMSFRAVWSFVKPLLDKRVSDSFAILGGPKEFVPRLVPKYVASKDQLPSFLGGNDESCNFDGREVGPWSEHLPVLDRTGDSRV